MRKLSKLQKKWISSWGEHSGSKPLHLLMFLFKLKVIRFDTFVDTKDNLIDNIKIWDSLNTAYKLQKQSKQQNFAKPPRSIKPTGTRF